MKENSLNLDINNDTKTRFPYSKLQGIMISKHTEVILSDTIKV